MSTIAFASCNAGKTSKERIVTAMWLAVIRHVAMANPEAVRDSIESLLRGTSKLNVICNHPEDQTIAPEAFAEFEAVAKKLKLIP